MDPLKKTEVVSVYKSGTKNNVNNYCLISLTSNLSKLLKRIILDRLIKFLDKLHITSNNQFDFRKGIGANDGLIRIKSIY